MSLAMPVQAVEPTANASVPSSKQAKPKKICREDPARTGSHMGGGRICKTAEQWRELDQAEADTSGMTGNSPTASSVKQGN
jgi:hypothetical protein